MSLISASTIEVPLFMNTHGAAYSYGNTYKAVIEKMDGTRIPAFINLNVGHAF